jgi:hypothetical protein
MSDEFRKHEYDALRAEILERIRDANTLIYTTAGGIGGAYAIIVTTFARAPQPVPSGTSFLVMLWFLIIIWTPVIFAFLALVKSHELWELVMEAAAYVRKIEELEYGSDASLCGWEHRMIDLRARTARSPRRWIRQPYTAIYLVAAASTFVIAAFSTGYIASEIWPKLQFSLSPG